MRFRLLGGDQRSTSSASTATVAGTMSGSAASLREVVAAADRAVIELEAVVDSQPDRTALEAEIARTLLLRAKGFRSEAAELLQILERALQKLGPDTRPATPPKGLPFNRRSTDPGGAERLKGAPSSTWRGPERRRSTVDANMADRITPNGNPTANEGAKQEI